MSRIAKTTVGHPVEVTSGSVFTAWHDFELSGYIPLIWRRFYSTANLSMTFLGHGWVTQFFMSIREEKDFLYLKDEEGRDIIFLKPDAKGKSINPDEQMEFQISNSGYMVWDKHHKKRYYFSFFIHQEAYLITRIEDYSGNSISIRYDEKQRPYIIEQSSVARNIVLKYEKDDLIRSIDLQHVGSSPVNLVQYSYDSSGNLIEAIDPLGATIRYYYDKDHRLITEVNQLGGAFNFEYDRDGKCTRSWGDGGYLERRINYDVKRRTTRVTDSVGGTSIYFYNENGVVQKQVDALGNVTENQHLPGSDIRINSLGYVRARKYDENANLIKYTDSLGRTHNYTYNELGLCTSITDPDGNLRKWTYNDQGRLIKFEDPLGNSWIIERGERGEILKETDPEGRELKKDYAIDLSWLEISDGLGKFRMEYDAKGNPVFCSDSSGILCYFETDAVGRVISRKMADGSEVRFTYDKAGNIIQVKYLNGATWRYEYDAFGHIIGSIDPNGRSVRVRYNTEGQRISITNDRGEEYQEKYDLKGQVIERKFFDGRVEKYVYDAIGQIIQIHKPDGNIIYRQYDACTNMIEEGLLKSDEKEIIATYEYDWRRKMLKATSPFVTIEFIYDPAGRLIGEKQNDFELVYEYDKSRKFISRELLNGSVGKVSFEYDESGLLKNINDKDGVVQGFKYNNRGLMTSRSMLGGIEESFSYDNKSRLIYQSVRYEDRQIVQRDYSYDFSDNIISLQDSLKGDYKFWYDSQLHLIKSLENGKTENIELSRSSEILSINDEKFEYAYGDRIISVGKTSFDYDNNGNIKSKRDENGITQYLYDVKGQLMQVILPNSETVQFKYDPLGRRIEKQSSKGKTTFVWSSTRLTAIIREGKEPTEMLIGFGTWRPSVQWIGKEIEHYITDSIGKPQEVLDTQGNIKWWWKYSAYGKTVELRCDDPESYCIRFPGQYEDIETGLFYNISRYYDPIQARYITPDLIGIAGDINLYTYPRNPINWTDPMAFRCPNPELIDQDDANGWRCFLHDDGTMTMEVDCSRAYANRRPGDVILRPTIQTGDDNAVNCPECFVGRDGRIVVMEGQHRSAAASHGAQVNPDPDNPHLGGVAGRPGHMSYEYSPEYNDPDTEGVPLQDLRYPPEYPHQIPGVPGGGGGTSGTP